MKINWSFLIFVIFMIGTWLMVMMCFISFGEEKQAKEEEHRRTYKVMPTDEEHDEIEFGIRWPETYL